jgi:hypothetical protein
MTIRNFNYTGRQKIQDQFIDVKCQRAGQTIRATGRLDLAALDLPKASARIDVYRGNDRDSLIVHNVDRELSFDHEFSVDAPAEVILMEFQMYIPDGPELGRILASRAKFKPPTDEGSQGGRSLLPFSARDLGQLLWKIDVSGDQPEVVINSKIGDWKGFSKSANFYTVAMPVIVGEIADWLWRESASADPGDNEIAAQWKAYFLKNLGIELENGQGDQDENRAEWVDSCVNAFSAKHRLFDKWESLNLEGEAV